MKQFRATPMSGLSEMLPSVDTIAGVVRMIEQLQQELALVNTEAGREVLQKQIQG